MVLCLLVYRLAAHRLREQLAATGQTVPNQVSKPTDRPTMRWIFQCFEGINLLTFLQPAGPPQQAVTELQPLHEQDLALLGPSYEKLYKLEGGHGGMWGAGWYLVSPRPTLHSPRPSPPQSSSRPEPGSRARPDPRTPRSTALPDNAQWWTRSPR